MHALPIIHALIPSIEPVSDYQGHEKSSFPRKWESRGLGALKAVSHDNSLPQRNRGR